MVSFIRRFYLVATFSLLLISPALAASGSFIGVEGERVSGTATITDTAVTLSSDFRSSRGPDLYVYLGNSGPSKIIAKLEKRQGAQVYQLPAGIDLSKYTAVFIHCKRFNHTFGKAVLKSE